MLKKITSFVLPVIIVIGLGTWVFSLNSKNESLNILLENQYQRMFNSLIVDVEDIQVNLSKIMVTESAKQNIMIFSDIINLSYDAQENLSQLPINQESVKNTNKFLSQIGDISKAFCRKNVDGNSLGKKDFEVLEELHNYSNELAQELITLQGNIYENGLNIGELAQKLRNQSDTINKDMITTNFVNIEERMQEYPELIYDGAFSEHIKNNKMKLTGRTIEKSDLKNIAQKFIGNTNNYKVKIIGEVDQQNISAYIVELVPIDEVGKTTITMAITKNGGKIKWMLTGQVSEKNNIKDEDAIKIAKAFLKRNDYINMVVTYTNKYNGELLINFAYKQDDVLMYPDLIKVKVSLDNGNIVGFESEGYLFNHQERDISNVKISYEKIINDIASVSLKNKSKIVVIPTKWGTEVMCYEIDCEYKGDRFLKYYNCETGEQEKIIQVLIKDEGILML